ncbi:sulfatase family protein [Pontiella sulfatireligans]|uniref:Arylsulfatase n=1 Tax=Pontiella sulfatireligans TaxID=2750658 RepID=A0A6C2UQB9_9BACT|nr:sulfatase [Pontiella sulfatireligans]SPS74505.1 sulfatase S1_8 [Kiritimatiellales bacterium]VGO22408.1 Arylsulfatase [Pontiella sulfatireligans]
MKHWITGGIVAVALLTGAETQKPNILFALADDMSHASAYGYEFVQTPNFDSIAEGGLLFNRMYTPSSKCAPSRAVMITGRNPWQLEAAANHQPIWPEKFKSVVEALADNGYFAGFTGKGWNPGIHPKGRLLTGKEYNAISIEPTSLKVAKYDYAENFRVFLADKPPDQPFFFWYGCKEPHRGYAFKSGVNAGKKFEDLDFLPSFWGDADEVKHDILDYAVEVEYFDRQLGKILQQLEEAGELENTLIIATSDNGMPFPRYKGHPHEFATRLPFVVKWPGHIVDPGRDCNAFASFIDLAPTLLEAAGIPATQSGMQPIEGKSLSDFFSNTVAGRDQVLTGRERNDMCRPNSWGYPVRSFHKGDYVYMHNFEPDRWPCGNPDAGFRDTDWGPVKSYLVYKQEGTTAFELCFGKRPGEELYNVKADPECLKNLAANPEYAAMKGKMKSALFAELAIQGDPRMHGNGAIFDYARPSRATQYDDLVKQVEKGKKKKKK